MKRILLDGQPFTFGEDLQQMAYLTKQPISKFSFHIDDQKAELYAKCNSMYELSACMLKAGYPPSEIDTWGIQREEALAWNLDNSRPTPWIDNAALVRGIDRVELATRIVRNTGMFASASSFLTGRRQGIEDAITAATTQAELNAIVFDFTLPRV